MPPTMTTAQGSPPHPLRLIARNASMLLASTVVIQVLALFSGMILTRHLQASGYGQYAFSYVFAWFLLLVMNLGSKGILLRDLSRQPEKAGFYLSQVLLLRSFLAVVAMILAVTAGHWLAVPPDVQATMGLFMLVSVTDSLALAFVDTFRGLEDMRHEAWLYAVERLAFLIGVALAAHQGWSVVTIVQILYGITLCRTVAWLIPVRRRITVPPIRIDWSFWRYLFREGWQYLRVDLASALVQRADVLLLGALAAAAEAGRYNAAYTVYQLSQVAPQMLTGALQPTSSRLSHQSPETLIPIQLRVAAMTVVLAMPVVIGLGTLGPTLMGLLFGSTFVEAGVILRWLTLALPVLILSGFLTNHLFATDRQDLTFRVVLVNAVLNVGLNLLLIPRWGSYGAVVATVISETLALTALLAITWTSIGRPLLLQSLSVWALGMGSYGLTVKLLGYEGWVGAGASCVLYALGLAMAGRLPRSGRRWGTPGNGRPT